MTDAVTLNFIDQRHFERIMLVHDTVMGGRSSGTVVRHDQNALRFSGSLSLENNGGFALALVLFPVVIVADPLVTCRR